MKRILIISTGGTICSRLIDGCRRLAPDVSEATVITNFYKNEKYVSLPRDIFENSGFPVKTLSENMTFSVLDRLVSHMRDFDLSRYSGAVILHGTDTLAYTASLLAMVFSQSPIPIMLVSGDAPPDMAESNANANFETAVDLILGGVSPNVYVPYRNSDGKVRVHLGSVIMQSPNFSSDFYSAEYFDSAGFEEISRKRKAVNYNGQSLDSSVMMLHPYVNLDYSKIDLDGITAVAHGGYHSGTFCTEGGNFSILTLADNCHRHDILLFVAPCKLGDGQYESVYSALSQSEIFPVSMTLEMLYIKLTLAVSMGLHGEAVKKFVMTEFNSEIV